MLERNRVLQLLSFDLVDAVQDISLYLPLAPTRTPKCQSCTKPGTCSAHCRKAREYLNLRRQRFRILKET